MKLLGTDPRPKGALRETPHAERIEKKTSTPSPDPAPLAARGLSTRPTGKKAGPPAILDVLKRAATAPAKLIAPHTLRLTNPEGARIEVPASNYYLTRDGGHRPEIKDLVAVLLSRSPAHQAKIDRSITEDHALHEMSFRVKGKSGKYDRIFKVPCYGAVIPISTAQFETLVQSTGPVMRALRKMLQTIYSKRDPSAEDLGIAEMPKEDRQRVLSTIRGSIYLEPKMIDPAMKDYPFLTVGGFDAAMGDLDRLRTVFFEYNLGTPSGLSNNVQLLEIVRQRDPELFATLAQRLQKDDTFGILRRAVESNALAWTKNQHGVSVVLSPGVANGAHPDVASIAMFSGMPLVNPSDLYEDQNGDIRLNTGRGRHHPTVTGIYGRMEESYFLQNTKDGIPIRSPSYMNNPRLGKKLGVELEPGVVYAFQYDEGGRRKKPKIVGVERNADGSPKLQEVYESIGRDPARPNVEPGSFARAIKQRKLYYSGLGGRVVDDKRVFQAVSRHLAPRYLNAPDAPIASPPRTLNPSEYRELYETEHPEDYVIKDPDKSGGEGVKLMCMLPKAEQRQAIESVRSDPHGKIVQERASPSVMLVPEASTPGKKADAFGTIMPDWRIFAVMDGAGRVEAGPSSFLVRAAKPYSLSTNTSQGANYAIGAVLGTPAEAPVDLEASILPYAPFQTHVGVSRRFDLDQFLQRLDAVTDLADPSKKNKLPKDGTVSLLAQCHREIFELLGRKHSWLMSAARSWDARRITRSALYEALLKARLELLAEDRFTADVADQVKRHLAAWSPASHAPKAARDREALLAKLSIEPISLERVRSSSGVHKLEVGRYLDAPHPYVKKVLGELKRAGGEMRRVRENTEADGTGVWQADPAGAEFRVDSQGRPIIDIDLTQDFALSALAHEREHFLLWAEEKAKLSGAGMSSKDAGLMAMQKVNETRMRVKSEQRAVTAEMAMERADRSEWNRGTKPQPQRPGDPNFISRITYPEVEGVRDLLHRARWSGEPLDQDHLFGLLEELVRKSSELRRAGFDALCERAKHLRGVDALKTKIAAYSLRETKLYDLVFPPSTVARFISDGTSVQLEELWSTALERATSTRLRGRLSMPVQAQQ